MDNDYPLTMEHVKLFLATKQDNDVLGISCNSMFCLLSETLNWLYPEREWRVDVGTYGCRGEAYQRLDETLDHLRRLFDESGRLKNEVTKSRLMAHLQWRQSIKSDPMPFAVSDLFGEGSNYDA